ncbi:methyltransferase [Natrinema salaciae]|uniref:Dimerisation domain-containing protein n=1 Tax=Natrinema salaciae TaxID=1186196 RepID=A0A1H9NPD0_9EURY|nr:methyltransferase [Natrinema salaciae]SER37874.1 Dimerisation domain-containing protein [Natrinema salaciae]
MTVDSPNPERILDIGQGFWASKTLMSATKLGVFTELDRNGPQTVEELEDALGLHPRGSRDFLDALVALDLLDREDGQYRNTPESAAFLVEGKPTSFAGWFEMINDRLYPFWSNLETALRTGRTQNELDDEQTHPFEGVIYQDDEILEQFVGAMTSLSMGAAEVFAHEFPWKDHETVVDLGTSEGIVPKRIAEENDHVHAIGADLPRIEPYFQDFAGKSPAADRIEFQAADFFADEPLPAADVYILGHILHDWGLDDKRAILAKVAEAVNPGGAIIVYGTMIDEERRDAELPLLMSLNMLIETPDGSDYTAGQCIEWVHEAGFEGGEAKPLPGPDTMVVARK